MTWHEIMGLALEAWVALLLTAWFAIDMLDRLADGSEFEDVDLAIANAELAKARGEVLKRNLEAMERNPKQGS